MSFQQQAWMSIADWVVALMELQTLVVELNALLGVWELTWVRLALVG